jgi:endonuclease
MADMIYKNPALISRDFKPLSREEHTKYGFIDVFGYDKSNTLIVVECKRYSADFTAVDQLLRYIKKIKQLKGVENVRGIIAAPKISPNALQMLRDHNCEFLPVNPPKYLEKYDKNQQKLSF